MNIYNYFYSLLCPESTQRKCTNTGLIKTDKMTAIIDVLIPTQCNIQQKMVLAELYIRLIKTDAGLNKRLLHIDPYNSYDIVAYEDIAEPAYYIDLQQIADNIKKLQIMNVRYTDVIGYLLIALEQLIKLCEELHA